MAVQNIREMQFNLAYKRIADASLVWDMNYTEVKSLHSQLHRQLKSESDAIESTIQKMSGGGVKRKRR